MLKNQTGCFIVKKMINLEEENNKKVRALLVGEPGNSLSELKGLTDTLGLETAGTIILTRLEVKIDQTKNMTEDAFDALAVEYEYLEVDGVDLPEKVEMTAEGVA